MERIAVIGAGIIGASVALRLAQQGLSVTLYDSGCFAGEASTAGAGMLAPGGEANQMASWAQDTVASRAIYREFVQELEEASGMSIDFRECGAVDLALDEDEWDSLLRRYAVQQQLGIEVETLTPAEIRQLVPSLSPELSRSPLRGLWFPGDAVVNPRDVTGALAMVLPRLRVAILEHTPVSVCTWKGTHFQLRSTAVGPLGDADGVVVAAGAWTGSLDLRHDERPLALPRKAIPVRGHLIHCQRESGALGPIVRHGHLYIFQRASGAVLAGSNEELVGFQRSPNLAAVSAIHQHTEQLLPGLFPPVVDTYWLGFRPGIVGSGPEVRRLGEFPLWLAYGHYRNGILLAPHTARQITQEVAAAFGGEGACGSPSESQFHDETAGSPLSSV